MTGPVSRPGAPIVPPPPRPVAAPTPRPAPTPPPAAKHEPTAEEQLAATPQIVARSASQDAQGYHTSVTLRLKATPAQLREALSIDGPGDDWSHRFWVGSETGDVQATGGGGATFDFYPAGKQAGLQISETLHPPREAVNAKGQVETVFTADMTGAFTGQAVYKIVPDPKDPAYSLLTADWPGVKPSAELAKKLPPDFAAIHILGQVKAFVQLEQSVAPPPAAPVAADTGSAFDQLGAFLHDVGQALDPFKLIRSAIGVKHKLEQGQALKALHAAPDQGVAGAQPVGAAELQDLQGFMGRYMQGWSHTGGHFSSEHVLGTLYKPDAHIEDLAPNLFKAPLGVVEFTYRSPADYQKPIDFLYNTADRFVLKADPADLRAVRLPGPGERYQLMSPFASDLTMKGGLHMDLEGISRLIVERGADGQLRVADELLAPMP